MFFGFILLNLSIVLRYIKLIKALLISRNILRFLISEYYS
jgi:hypothetical protein